MIRYTLRLFGRVVAELTVESDGFEIEIHPATDTAVEVTEPLKWGEDDALGN